MNDPMLSFRLLLIAGLLLHPFCGHCLANLRATCPMPGSVSAVLVAIDSQHPSPPHHARCTKSPCVATAKVDLKPLPGDAGIVQTVPIPVFAEMGIDDLSSITVPLSRSLSLLLSVIRF